MRILHALPVLLVSSLAAHAGNGSQVQLEPARDNTIFEDASGGISNGSGDFVVAGNNGQGKTRRALLAFEVAAALPAGSTVTGASLTLTLRQTSSGPHTVELRRAGADWGEGASVASGGSGATAEPGDATWLHTFYDTDLWTSVGGDFSAASSGGAVVDQAGAYTWSSPELVADVQAMLDDPAADFGWFLVSDETQPQTTKLFGSRESAVVSERPLLVIDFVPGPLTYCTAGTSSSGCVASLSASGVPSATAASGFTVTGPSVEGDSAGVFCWGIGGRMAEPFRRTSSLLCVRPPLLRTGPMLSGGSAGSCDGTLAVDLNAAWAAGRRPGAGATVQVQLWYRDQRAGALSDALELIVCP